MNDTDHAWFTHMRDVLESGYLAHDEPWRQSGMSGPERTMLPGSHPTRRILDRLEELGLKPARHRDGHDPVRDRKVRVVVLRR